MHFTGWLIFLLAVFAFRGFFAQIRKWIALEQDDSMAGGLLVAFGYSVFLAFNATVTLWFVTPDLLLEVFLFLSTAIVIRCYMPAAGAQHYTLLGFLLGVSYFAKAVMFPLSLLLFAILLLRPPDAAKARSKVLLAMLAFGLTALPLVASLSREKGRFTFGDSGRLNMAWNVGRLTPYFSWSDAGNWTHPPKTISVEPRVSEYGAPIRGTFPLWSDPTYWNEGISSRVGPAKQIKAFLRSVGLMEQQFLMDQTGLFYTTFLSMAGIFGALTAGLLSLLVFGGDAREGFASIRRLPILFVWPVLAAIGFMAVMLNQRYIAGFSVIWWIACYLTFLPAAPRLLREPLLLTVMVALFFANLGDGVRALSHTAGEFKRGTESGPMNRGSAFDDFAMAEGFRAVGLRPGDRLADIGPAMVMREWYPAHLTGLRVTSHVWLSGEDWARMDAAKTNLLIAKLKVAGIRAIVSDHPISSPGWIPLPDREYCIRLL